MEDARETVWGINYSRVGVPIITVFTCRLVWIHRVDTQTRGLKDLGSGFPLLLFRFFLCLFLATTVLSLEWLQQRGGSVRTSHPPNFVDCLLAQRQEHPRRREGQLKSGRKWPTETHTEETQGILGNNV